MPNYNPWGSESPPSLTVHTGCGQHAPDLGLKEGRGFPLSLWGAQEEVVEGL